MFCRSCLKTLLIQTCQPFSGSLVGHGMTSRSMSRRAWRSQRVYFYFYSTVSDLFFVISFVSVRLLSSGAVRCMVLGNVGVVGAGLVGVGAPGASAPDTVRLSLIFETLLVFVLSCFSSSSVFVRFLFIPQFFFVR